MQDGCEHVLDAIADLADVLTSEWGNCTHWQAADRREVWITNRVARHHGRCS